MNLFFSRSEYIYSIFKLLMIHYGSFFYFFLFNFVNIFFLLAQTIYDKVFGLDEHIAKIKHGLLYEKSAHVKTVLAACKPCPMDKVRSKFNFVTWHHSFEDPTCVLADNVVLAEVTMEKAVFIQLPLSIAKYSVSNAPFLFITLVYDAKSIIEIPLDIFFRLSAEIGRPKSHVTLMYNSGRCGSTLVAKIVEHADRWETLVLSEPPVLMDMYIMKSLLQQPDYQKLLGASLNFLLKSVTTKKKIVIKTTYFIINIASDIHQLLPDATPFYCHRDPLRTVIAHERAFGLSALYQVLRFVMMLKKWNVFSYWIGLQKNPPVGTAANLHLNSTMFETCCVIWADNYLVYEKSSRCFHFPSVCYEDIFENAENFCKDILSLNGIDNVHLMEAMSALDDDSQEDTFVGQKMLRRVKPTLINFDLKNRVDNFCLELKLPKFQWENAKTK